MAEQPEILDGELLPVIGNRRQTAYLSGRLEHDPAMPKGLGQRGKLDRCGRGTHGERMPPFAPDVVEHTMGGGRCHIGDGGRRWLGGLGAIASALAPEL